MRNNLHTPTSHALYIQQAFQLSNEMAGCGRIPRSGYIEQHASIEWLQQAQLRTADPAVRSPVSLRTAGVMRLLCARWSFLSSVQAAM